MRFGLPGVLLALCGAGLSPAAGQTDPCGAIRASYEKSSHRLYVQLDGAFVPLSESSERFTQRIRQPPTRLNYNFLASATQAGVPTVYAALVAFEFDGSESKRIRELQKVFTFNNIRKKGQWADYAQFKRFHDEENYHVKDLREWFHLGPSISQPDIVDTARWEYPRAFFSIDEQQKPGAGGIVSGAYAFLFSLKAINEAGSCIPLDFFLPSSTRALTLTFRNLRPAENGSYDPPDVTSVPFQ